MPASIVTVGLPRPSLAVTVAHSDRFVASASTSQFRSPVFVVYRIRIDQLPTQLARGDERYPGKLRADPMWPEIYPWEASSYVLTMSSSL